MVAETTFTNYKNYSFGDIKRVISLITYIKLHEREGNSQSIGALWKSRRRNIYVLASNQRHDVKTLWFEVGLVLVSILQVWAYVKQGEIRGSYRIHSKGIFWNINMKR